MTEFNKKQYWANRSEGKRGVESLIPTPVLVRPSGVHISFDVEGHMVVQNRSYRRKSIKLPTDMQKKKTKRKRN